MKLLYFIICLIVISNPGNILLADQAHDLFKEANQSYQDGDYNAAAELYESILSGGMESAELYYNLGNAYYKLNKMGYARLNYERVLLWLENDEAVIQNLNLLKLHLVDQIEEPPRLFIAVWWEGLLNLFDKETWANFVLFLFWILLIVVSLYLYYQKRGRIKFKSLLVSALIIWLFSVAVWSSKIYLFESQKHGVILVSTVTVHAEPSEKTTELFVIHEGTKVQINRSNSEWLEIKLIDGKTGWLKNSALEII